MKLDLEKYDFDRIGKAQVGIGVELVIRELEEFLSGLKAAFQNGAAPAPAPPARTKSLRQVNQSIAKYDAEVAVTPKANTKKKAKPSTKDLPKQIEGRYTLYGLAEEIGGIEAGGVAQRLKVAGIKGKPMRFPGVKSPMVTFPKSVLSRIRKAKLRGRHSPPPAAKKEPPPPEPEVKPGLKFFQKGHPKYEQWRKNMSEAMKKKLAALTPEEMAERMKKLNKPKTKGKAA